MHKCKLLYVGLLSFLVASCSKFLDVKPEDRFTEDMVYSNATSIQQALNGIYNSLTSNSLYGANLTSTTIELMGQRYNTTFTSSQYVNYQAYSYTQSDVQGTFENVWKGAYSHILSLNVFIAKLSNSKSVLGEDYSNLLLGEAYGLRAFIHFDLLRLFGPVYNTSDSTVECIPYNVLYSGESSPYLPANAVIDSVQKDLGIATQYLQNDPIKTKGTQDSTLSDGYDFYRFRNRRMNYFATKALLARVYLYRGNKQLANAEAKEVLSEGEKWFGWLPYTSVVATSQANPDRIFSTEVIFGLYNTSLYSSVQSNYFASSIQDAFILAPLASRLTSTYESNINDYRYTISNTWQSSGKSYMTFFKYADVSSSTAKFRYFQPLIRKTELYYILAETESANPLAYIDTVRVHRGLQSLSSSTVLADEIKKEYQKEFFGEGQIFFYYKRLNATTIPSSNSTGNVTMTAAKYVVPLPLSETENR